MRSTTAVKAARILVVDDEPEITEIIEAFLVNAGYQVKVENTPGKALVLAKEFNPDLILLDCSMPVLDGYEVLERMRKDPVLYSKPVIMLTVLSGEYDEIKGLELGADDYITKPFRSAQLIARINSVLERKGLR